jgi:hypothetical protein
MKDLRVLRMVWCEYKKRGRIQEKNPSRRRLNGVERYINKVKAGGGSQSFKNWLTSKPMYNFVVKKNRGVSRLI